MTKKKKVTIAIVIAIILIVIGVMVAISLAGNKSDDKKKLTADDKSQVKTEKTADEVKADANTDEAATTEENKAKSDSSQKATGQSNKQSSSSSGSSSSSNSSGSTASTPSHSHNWVAVYSTRQIPHTTQEEWCMCVACGADITSNVDAHMDMEIERGNSSQWRSQYRDVTTYTTESYISGYKCSCGATK